MRTSRIVLVLAALLGAGIVATGVLVAVHGTTAANGCTHPDAVVISAAPSVATLVRDAANRAATKDCIAPQVITESSAATASDLTDPTLMSGGSAAAAQAGATSASAGSAAGASGTAAVHPRPALWIPDSTIWPKLAAAGALGTKPDATVDLRPAIAMTPLVVATPKQLLDPTQAQPSWTSVLASNRPAVITDPTLNTDGISSLAVLATITGNGPDAAAKLVAALIRVAHATVHDDAAAFAAAGSLKPTEFPAAEQAVIAQNHAVGRADITAVYPQEGTVPMEVPVVRLSRATDTPGMARAADAVERELRAPETLRAALAAGFRSPTGELADGYGTADGVSAEPPQQLPAPPIEGLVATAKLWSAVTVDSRLLNIIDISGSMAAPAGNNLSRIGLAIANSLEGLSLFPDTSAIGLWAFSSKLNGDVPWVEMVPVRTLTDQLSPGVTVRQALSDQTKVLAGRIGGSTGLYDTTLAAIRMMRATYDPTKVNTISLTTDGKDEGGASHIDLPTLLATLKADADPTRPIAVIGVGIGPDADMNALNQIAAATSGKAYNVNTLADEQRIFLDALSLRRCRPRC
jgi:hypothetical protein